ncbi:inositol monophosphatase [Aureimonas flava]|uniref:Inositol-1-monophosphatase n=1 Tax=Aureimonas flava TaxID=2320271 RepID=A0A3A1WPC0_9HYPH|nr:inositol monophosphatase [Aureimonas flava]RIY01852.1 inositol monophosphatase [Aureimonas flava]
MNSTELDRRAGFALDLIREAGVLALDYFRRVDTLSVSSKGPQDVVSEADVAVEKLIRDRLAEAFPDDAFFGEESGRSDFSAGQGIWVVDPIDGTQPFVCGMSSWCISIAFVEGGVNRMGFVNAPARGELFAGGAGRGATLNGEPIRVRRAASVGDGLIATGYSTRRPPSDLLPVFGRLLEGGGMFYRDGSGALALAYVAAGRLIGYLESHINSYDCLGAMAVIEGAGGQVSDFLAGDSLFVGNALVAASPELFPALRDLARYA